MRRTWRRRWCWRGRGMRSSALMAFGVGWGGTSLEASPQTFTLRSARGGPTRWVVDLALVGAGAAFGRRIGETPVSSPVATLVAVRARASDRAMTDAATGRGAVFSGPGGGYPYSL